MSNPMTPVKGGRILYLQGRWRCRVVSDSDTGLCYEPMEGAPPIDIGKRFDAGRCLFAPRRMTPSEFTAWAASGGSV